MWELDCEESWVLKNWCFWTVVLEKTLESPLDCKEIQPVHPKGDQSWIFIGRTDVEAETPTLWPPDAKSWLICKDPDAGKDWGREEKGMIDNEMVGWHHWLNGHETPGVGDGQGGLACCRVHGVTKRRTRLSDWSKVKTMWPHGLYSPWNSPGQNTGVVSHSLLQGIFLQPRDWTQVSHIAGGFSANWATREAHMPEVIYYSNLFVTA